MIINEWRCVTPEGTVRVEDLRNPHRFICEEFLAETVPWASITTE